MYTCFAISIKSTFTGTLVGAIGVLAVCIDVTGPDGSTALVNI